jgi:hypothetical protein
MQQLGDELEKRPCAEEHNYITVLRVISELKNQLTVHWGCRDINVDKWIEREASRFVYRDTSLHTNARN